MFMFFMLLYAVGDDILQNFLKNSACSNTYVNISYHFYLIIYVGTWQKYTMSDKIRYNVGEGMLLILRQRSNLESQGHFKVEP